MKKKLIAMAIAASLSVTAGVAFAANPFTDVPAKHWSYDAVAQLAKAGVIEGYNDGTFRGEKTITRYEMAVIVAKAMAKEQTANANTKAVIDKLAAEYSDELTNLGVRVSALEAKAGSVTFSGTARVRYDYEKTNETTVKGDSDRNLNIELVANAKINDGWNAVAKIEGNKQYSGTTPAEKKGEITKYYVTGNFMGGQLLVGKDGFTPGYKVVLDNDITGVRYTFGNVVKATVWQGLLAGDAMNTLGITEKDVKTYGIQLGYALSDKTNVGFVAMDAKAASTGEARKFYELGADTKLGKDFTLAGAYARSNADSAKTAYMAQLTYKAADSKVVGSYDIWAKYAKNEDKAVLKGGNDIDHNQKGYQIGFDYVPMANTKFTAWYFKKNAVDLALGTTDADNKYRAQMEFYF